MKYCRTHRYYFLAATAMLMLAGCAPDGSQESSGKLVTESDQIRKQGNDLVAQGKLREAVEVFDKLIAKDPENALAYNGKAVAFDYGGNHLAAQDIYQTALSHSPESLAVKNNLAMSLILNHQIDQAITLLESLVTVKGATPAMSKKIRHNLALAYGITGQEGKANKLNLESMTPEQAQENLKFYKSYVARNSFELKSDKKIKKIIASNNHNIGFITPNAPTIPAITIYAKRPAKKDNKRTEDTPEDDNSSAVYTYPN